MNPITDSIIGIAGKVLDRIIPDKAAAEKAKQELAATAQTEEFQLSLKQIEVNVAEAQSGSIFIGGWRPFTGWVCGFALAYVAMLEPMIRFGAMAYGYKGGFPVIDTTITMQVLLGMLGLAGARSFEKAKSVAAK